MAVLVLVLLLFVAMLGAISGGGAGTSSLRVGAASEALTVALTLAAVAAVVALGLSFYMMMIRHRGRGEPVTRRRSAWSRMIVVLAIGVALAFARLLASRHAHPRSSLAPFGVAPKPVRASSSAVSFRPVTSLSTLGVVLFIALLVAFVSWRGAVRRRRRIDFELLDRSPEVSVYAASDLAGSLVGVAVPDPSEEADPRRAVVAAYLAMLDAAARAGCRRRPEVTPSEFLVELLGELGVSPASAGRLTALFERARYSSLAVDETLRTSAIETLAEVRNEIREPAAQSA